jgi:hypothetical protein
VSLDFDVELKFMMQVGKTTDVVFLRWPGASLLFTVAPNTVPPASRFRPIIPPSQHVFIPCFGIGVVPCPPSCYFGLFLLFVSTSFAPFLIGLEMLNARFRTTSRSASS